MHKSHLILDPLLGNLSGLTKTSVISSHEKGTENFDNCFMYQVHPQFDHHSCLADSAKFLPANIVGNVWIATVSYKPKISVLDTRKIKARKKNCSASPQNQQPLLDNYSGNGYIMSECLRHPSVLTTEGSKRLKMSIQNKSTIKVRKKLTFSCFPSGSKYCIHYPATPDFVVSKF